MSITAEIPEISIVVAPQVTTLTVAKTDYTIEVSQAVTEIISVAEQGPMGPPGGATTTEINITQPGTTWTLAHYLNRFPTLTVVDTAGDLILASYSYQDRNTIIVSFSMPTSGVAYLN